MVALNESFASEYPSLGSKNRVGDFFAHEAKSRRVNRLSAQQPRRGKAHDYDETASGMFYYGFRYYDHVTGRWPSRDPLGEDWSENLYRVIGNNLNDKVDYLGLVDADEWLGVDHWTGRTLPPDHPALRPDQPLFDIRDVLRAVCRATATLGRFACRSGAQAGCIVTCTSCNILAPACYSLCIVSTLFACELNYVGAVLLCNQI
jgi:RHS repeat-associated protein